MLYFSFFYIFISVKCAVGGMMPSHIKCCLQGTASAFSYYSPSWSVIFGGSLYHYQPWNSLLSF